MKEKNSLKICYLLHRNRNLLLSWHILQPNLIIQEGLEQCTGTTPGTVHVPLTVSHRVVGVHTTLTSLIQSSQDVTDVVGEEALVVEHDGGHLCHSGCIHHLAVVMEVTLHAHTRNLENNYILKTLDLHIKYSRIVLTSK